MIFNIILDCSGFSAASAALALAWEDDLSSPDVAFTGHLGSTRLHLDLLKPFRDSLGQDI